MNNLYVNNSNQTHTLIVRHKKTRNIVEKKSFTSESFALNYLNFVQNSKKNSASFEFTIIGPNMYYYTS